MRCRCGHFFADWKYSLFIISADASCHGPFLGKTVENRPGGVWGRNEFMRYFLKKVAYFCCFIRVNPILYEHLHSP